MLLAFDFKFKPHKFKHDLSANTPSFRNTMLFQKNMKELIVEFMLINVVAQRKNVVFELPSIVLANVSTL